MTTLLMFSGGIDSTAGLIHLLIETNDDLHVHHVIIRDKRREGWSIAQLEVVNKIIPYCKKRYRNFKFTTSVVDYRDAQERFISSYVGISFMLLVLLHQELDIERVIPIVMNKEDIDRNYIQSFWGHEPKHGILARLKKVEKFAIIDINRKITFDYLFMQTPRFQMVKKYLSKDLFDLTWSCEHPISSNIPWNDIKNITAADAASQYDITLPPIECGRCHSCYMKAKIEDTVWVEE